MTPSFPIPYIETALRFADEGIDCSWSPRCGVAEGEPAFAVHLIDGRPLCSMHSPYDNKYVPCTRCAIRPVLAPASVEIDPVCMTCQKEMHDNGFKVDEKGCPGFDDSCSEVIKLTDSLCEDCTGKKEAHAGTTIFATLAPHDGCPGWGPGEGECGNPKLEGSDLCGDCHGARTDYESPYPGNPRRYPC